MKYLACLAAIVFGLVTTIATSGLAFGNSTSEYLYYPLGHSHACPAGWFKRTERRPPLDAPHRYVACAIASSASVHLPPPPGPAVPLPLDSVDLTSNWAGYEASGSATYLAVGGQWIVPRLSCRAPQRNTASSVWVGVGGDKVPHLFQSGTEADCDFGREVAYTWFTDEAHDFLPVGGFSVRAGDVIYARDWQLSPGLWQYLVADLSTGRHITSRHGVRWSGPGTTAEWVVEHPGNGPVSGLSDFRSITFENLSVTPGDAEQQGLAALDMGAPGAGVAPAVVAATSGSSGTGASNGFTVFYRRP